MGLLGVVYFWGYQSVGQLTHWLVLAEIIHHRIMGDAVEPAANAIGFELVLLDMSLQENILKDIVDQRFIIDLFGDVML